MPNKEILKCVHISTLKLSEMLSINTLSWGNTNTNTTYVHIDNFKLPLVKITKGSSSTYVAKYEFPSEIEKELLK